MKKTAADSLDEARTGDVTLMHGGLSSLKGLLSIGMPSNSLNIGAVVAAITRRPMLRYVAIATALLSTPFAADAVPPAALADAAKVEWQWGVKIPLRDGVQLNATLYKPAGLPGPRPCLFTLTPYIAQSYHDRGMYFAAHGYPFLTVDVRGRGNSEGSFRPLIQEAKDGYDIVEWLAKQPYCNGKISMWGGSYAGYDQWATAKEFPPHLATIVPVASPAAGVDFPSRNSVFSLYDMQWLTFTGGHTSQDRLFGDDAFWVEQFRRWSESGTAYRKLDRFFGNPSPIFQEWTQHPDVDSYWDAYNPTSEEYAKMELPILTITGMYDDDQPGALAHYRRYMHAASAAGRARHFLVIGPWDHPGTRTPQREFKGMKFGPASLVDLPRLHLDWYRYAMEGGPRPKFLAKPVTYYVTGAECWQHAETLESVTLESRPFYLDSAGNGARELYSAGTLAPVRAGRGAADLYRYDPRDLSLAKIESESNLDSALDQEVLLSNPAKLLYLSAPFAQDQEISGFFQLAAWISIDQPDTDFAVTVAEVSQDGVTTPLSSDIMRARYRETRGSQKLVTTQEPLLYNFRDFTFASRLLRKGSRLEVVLSAANSIQNEKNYNSGGVVADETIEDSRPVTVKLFHDAKRRSALYVPFAAPQAAGASECADGQRTANEPMNGQ
jgi:putative CocE/NonD family hydrolase